MGKIAVNKIKLFGFLAAFLAPEVELELPSEFDKATILTALSNRFPHQKSDFVKCNVAVNQVYIFDEVVKRDEVQEIAIIPPVSGG